MIIGDLTEKVVRLLDPSRRGESTTVETCRGFVPATAFQVVGDAAAFLINCSDRTNRAVVADMRESEIVATIRDVSGQDMGLSPDGTRIVAQTRSGSIWGPLQVYDARSGETVVRLEGMCDWDDRFGSSREEAPPPCKPYPEAPFPIWAWHVEFSPDGRRIMLRDTGIAIWDADSGALIKALTEEDFGDFATGAIFTPDSTEMIVNASGDMLGISTSTWTIQQRRQLDPT